MADGTQAEVAKLEERINGDILQGLKTLYEKVGALAVPVEQSAASHLRTLLGEAHQVVTSVIESPASKQAVAVAEDAAAVIEQGKAVSDVPEAGQAPGGGPGAELSPALQKALSDLSDSYEKDREALIASVSAGGAQATAPGLPALGAPDAAAAGGGSPQGSV